MPTNHTPNYSLNQWVKSDQVKMEDFNADNAKIDAAIKAAQQKADGQAVSKADVSALNAEINARTAAVTAEINARTAAITAETNARTAAVNAINTAMTKLGNCQIQHFTYVGTGVDQPQTLTFSEKPLLVIIADNGGEAAVGIYGAPMFRVLNNSIHLTWTENSLSWRNALCAPEVTYHAIVFFSRS